MLLKTTNRYILNSLGPGAYRHMPCTWWTCPVPYMVLQDLIGVISDFRARSKPQAPLVAKKLKKNYYMVQERVNKKSASWSI